MGRVVPIGDAAALADALIDIIDHPANYHRDRDLVASLFSTDLTVTRYEDLFRSLSGRN